MLDWFVSRRASHVLMLLGALCAFFACFRIDVNKSTIIPQLLPEPNYIVAALGILMVVAGAVAPILEGAPPKIKRLAGEWAYSVSDGDAETVYGHDGVAEIIQQGQRIRIEGFRRNMWWQDDNGKHKRCVNIQWHTSWGWLDEEGVLRYDYDMPLSGREGRIMGYVRIQINGKNRNPLCMTGMYYMLPPYSERLPNTRFGTITWTRVSNKDRWWNRLTTVWRTETTLATQTGGTTREPQKGELSPAQKG